MKHVRGVLGLGERLVHESVNVAILTRAGIVRPVRPDRLVRMAWAGLRWGVSPAALIKVGAARHPHRLALIDERGPLSYAELDRRSDALAAGLAEQGIRESDGVGLMCRDHRGFIESLLATAKLGADTMLLNTSFAGPQLREVAAREGVTALILDEEFTELLGESTSRRILAWEDSAPTNEVTTERLIAEHDALRPSVPRRAGSVTILTSGTTGTPKGARREVQASTLDPLAGLLERVPLREGDTIGIAAPLFHSWGLAGLMLSLGLGATAVLRRRFEPEAWLQEIEAHRCRALWVVPVMLARILALPEATREGYDTGSLRAVCASGSALPGELAGDWMNAFGENLYNLYGSTEVSAVTLATPGDLRAAPGTAGQPARGSVVRLLDEEGHEVAQGESGRIFVGNAMLFEGYTGGGSKDVVDGLMSTGDVGRFDEQGRLFVEGRADEMIVSGGENVFPAEVEDLLASHPAIAEAAVVGVPDTEFGQRLRAYVVLRPGERLDEDDIKSYVRSHLARYKVPREVVFLDELPRNPTGKVLKRSLA